MEADMSYIVKGVHDQDWQGANWVFYSLSEHLLPTLQHMQGAELLAERLEEALEMEIGYMDLSDLLTSPELSQAWSTAINATAEKLRLAGSTGWREPDRFEPFLQKVSELKSLVGEPQPAAA
jgi:hypothetical protein